MNKNLSSETSVETFFDSPERDSMESIIKEVSLFDGNTVVKQLLEGYPEVAVIINNHRQIVACNSKALAAFNASGFTSVIGKRFGEAIQCVHHQDHTYGCGTSRSCAECGAAKSIKTTNRLADTALEECRITVNADGTERALDLFIHTQPLNIYDKVYTIFAIRDLSHEKRRDALERIFFHDVLNTAGALSGIADMLPDAETVHEKAELTSVIRETSKQLLSEIISQRELRMAEDKVLNPEFKVTSVGKIISSVFELYRNHELSLGKYLEREKLNEELEFITDSTLLIRSIVNLFKNALEASKVDDIIKIYTSHRADRIQFNIFNSKVIPNSIQLQLFQRSFTTSHSKGRGIGLYSVKLIVEQYLKGKVSFISNETENTVFTISLPLNPTAS